MDLGTGGHLLMTRMITEDVILDLVVGDEAQLAKGTLPGVVVHAPIMS